jgi:hypothetical protein
VPWAYRDDAVGDLEGFSAFRSGADRVSGAEECGLFVCESVCGQWANTGRKNEPRVLSQSLDERSIFLTGVL